MKVFNLGKETYFYFSVKVCNIHKNWNLINFCRYAKMAKNAIGNKRFENSLFRLKNIQDAK